MLAQADAGGFARYCTQEERNEVPETLDAQMIKDARPLLEEGEKMQLAYNVRNVQRAVGTKLSHMITKRYGMHGLAPGHITVRLRGSAGQSLGAFAVQGLKLEVFGDANDYVGKGLSRWHHRRAAAGVQPLAQQREHHHRQHRACMAPPPGKLFAAGQAGERFAVRNSGADGGDRRLRLQRLRIHDRRHGRHPGSRRGQFRRRHDRRHGLRLRSRGNL